MADRLAIVRTVDQRFRLVDLLADIRATLRNNGMLPEAEGISDAIAIELDTLIDMTRPERPYAGLMRHLLRDARPS